MPLLLISFIAGILTVLAPCILPLLPIIIGGSVGTHTRNPYIITGSLAFAIVLFTILLKFSTLFINIPATVWSAISGVIILGFGFITLFPGTWEALNVKFGLSNRSDKLLSESAKTGGRWSDVLLGMSLGPVFSSCSPTYFLILATVLPRSVGVGIIYLIAYALGLSLTLLLISLLGQRFIKQARFAADPRGWFKRGLGILFILVGVLILTGKDKDLQTYLVQQGYYPTSGLEASLLTRAEPNRQAMTPASSASSSPMDASALTRMNKPFPRYREIANPSGYVNTEPLTISSLIGKKVILVDFMTYSCINCIRTFPYLNGWHDKYKDQGLEIVGIHTPEFAFEHKLENVKKELARHGITFPVVLDNDYGTWNAYGNNYWPRKYLIDIDGYVVYDHIGEGGYDETEKKIQELLKEKAEHDRMPTSMIPTGLIQTTSMEPGRGISPETYFGSARNASLGNELHVNQAWTFQPEYAEASKSGASIAYTYRANNVFFVASATTSTKVILRRDGKALDTTQAGDDAKIEQGESYVIIQGERLYHLLKDTTTSGPHNLEMTVEQPGLKAYTFTFG